MKYAIISISDRAKDNVNNTKNILSSFEEVGIRSVNGHTESIDNIMKDLSINKNNWQLTPQRSGEIGVWLSNIFVFKKIIQEDIDMLVLLEDDAILSNNFINIFNNLLKEVPKDFDFLALQYFENCRYLYKDDAEIGLNNICLAKYNGFGCQAILWSKSGATKMIESVNNTGLTLPIDLYMYNYLSRENLINGYSIKPDAEQIVFHDLAKYKSTIDLDGTRI